MPPSPALRLSPLRQLRTGNHKRGRSLDSGLQLKEKDDDLALFNNMQARERDNFLLQTADDFDDSLSKLRYFSNFNLGISIPVRGGSRDLLDANGEKNDYDWLLTPPDTPLFSSLDDDTPPVNLVRRGRPRSETISISRTANTEKNYRTGRSSASPHRSSPSRRSGSSTFQLRGRPSSAPRSSPAPVLHRTTPSRKPSTPPNKPSSPASSVSSPTLQRMSTGSSVQSFGGRGISPGKSRHGKSASPKLQAWQSTLPGFSSDPPPNLRTSLSDRPSSHVRGLSPASRNGKDSFSKFGRQSMSPTASRSGNSSPSYDRVHFSSQSKGSVASSGDDDMDSLHSVTVGVSDRPTSRKNGVFPSGKADTFSKKPFRTLSASSAPKRSFDSAVRQLDHHKSPQNMFRPLLSSVPTTTFYGGKGNTAHRPMVSRNSSVITSSYASSEQGVTPNTEGCDSEQDDISKEWGKAPYLDTQEQIFVFDKVDEINEDVGHGIHDGESNDAHESFDGSTTSEVQPKESENVNSRHAEAAVDATAADFSHVAEDPSDVDMHEMMASCSNCGNYSLVMQAMDGNATICRDCGKRGGLLTTGTSETTVFVTQSNAIHSEMALEENNVCDELGLEGGLIHLSEKTCCQAMFGKQEHDYLPDNCIAQLVVEEGEQHLVDQNFVGDQVVSSQSERDTTDQQLPQFDSHLSSKFDSSEAEGISVLLKKSSSIKWPVMQGSTFTASTISCEDPSYVRDSVTAKKSCIGEGNASTSSSADLGVSRKMEVCVQRQLSSRKADMGSSRDDSDARPLTRISFSGTTSNSSEALAYTKSVTEEDLDDFVRDVKDAPLVIDRNGCASEKKELADKMMNASASDCSELSSHTQGVQFEDTSAAVFPNDDVCVSSRNAKVISNNGRSIPDIEIQFMSRESIIEEDSMQYSHVCGIDVSDAPLCASLVMMVGEKEDGFENISISQSDCPASPDLRGIMEVFQEPSSSQTLENNTLVSTPETDISDSHSINEEPTGTVEYPRGQQKLRSLTMDEATDSKLFCSAIVHDLAYQAAIIAMEKKDSIPLEGSQPTVTILGKFDPSRRERQRTNSSKHTLKSQKTRKWQRETEAKFSSTKTENDVKIQESFIHVAVNPNKVDSIRPPKLESKCSCTVM